MPHLLLQLNQFLGNNTRNACHKPEISRSKSVVPPCQTIIGGEISETYMEVSQVMGVPPIIMYLKKIFHYKPSILGYPMTMETPIWEPPILELPTAASGSSEACQGCAWEADDGGSSLSIDTAQTSKTDSLPT